MDLNELQVFAHVVQAGSFTRASDSLRMPKSTVSRKVAALERRLGARLLQRTTRRMMLTEAGRAYFAHCQRVLAEAEAAERAVGHLQRAPRGVLRVAAPANLGQLLGPLVVEYLRTYPEVELVLACANRSVDLIEEGFDLAIRLGRVADSSLVARGLFGVPSMLVASPDYRQRRGVPSRPEDLAAHPCMAIASGPFHRNLQLKKGSRVVRVPIRGPLNVDDFDILRQAASSGLGIALLPAWRCSDDVASGRLEQLLTQWAAPVVPMHVVHHGARAIAPSARAFVDLLMARLPHHPAMEPIEQRPLAESSAV
jgi:DNA-binding transcriptional LysR family regulator